LFYVLWTDRIVTYWVDGSDDAKANPTYFNWKFDRDGIHCILLASGVSNDHCGIVQN
jgi:hypothetical protein